MSEVQNLFQFLLNGDVLGFLQAVYTLAFGSADVFYAVVMLGVTMAIYIRTKSLTLLSVIWIALGSFFILAMPLVSGIAILLLALGIGSILYQVFTFTRGGYG